RVAIQIFILQHNLTRAKIASSVIAGRLTQLNAQLWVIENRKTTLSHGGNITDIKEETVLSMSDDFRNTSDAGGDHGNFARHGFQSHQPERFQIAGKQQNVGDG